MQNRTLALGLIALSLIPFSAAFMFYERPQDAKETTTQNTKADNTPLVRDYSPVIGPENAPVTIVEFFDPSCEGCRAMYPYVKEILAEYPDDVRLVLRYVLFHGGSEEAVRILETARMQSVYKPVLDAVVKSQPQWHDDPKVKAAWEAAKSAGLDVDLARDQLDSPDIEKIIKQDMGDVQSVKIKGTPTFYVNGQKLSKLGPQELYDLVKSEVDALN
ncbi:MAG: thioredoxin domain-containing protein [Oceanospirillales bacterium]|mgnify:CR=1 FL=1|nr:thioredoxin domain-containing protein [Oceanospirillales bacterium]